MIDKPLGRAPFPQWTEKTSARLQRGHRMGPIKDGWMLVYENEQKPPTEDLDGELCVARTADHRMVTRILRKGWKPGTWDSITASNDHELDVVLIWAAKVKMIIPYNPTPEERELYGQNI